jgi:hypothetical protein
MDEEVSQNQTALRRSVVHYEAQQEEKRERIKTWMGACLVIVALCVDGLQALLNLVGIGDLFVSSIISVCADLVYTLWFWMLGVGFVKNPKIFAAMTIQALVGLVPVLDTLPELTVGILAIVLLVKAEDKGGMLGKVAGLAQGKINS